MKQLSLILFAFGCVALTAQQEPLNTQFMYNKLNYNPGFAGAKETTCLTAIHRSQWLGLEGAPTYQAFNANIPLVNQRVGVGLNVTRHTVGITENLAADGSYAYRVRAGRGDLGIGVQASVMSFTQNFRDSRITTTQGASIDPSVPTTQEQKFLFNAGAGLYYSSTRFYAGISVPRLIGNNLEFGDDNAVISRQMQHVYFMAGYAFELNDNLAAQPQLLLRYVDGAPLDADLNLSVLFSEVFVAGVTYRLGGAKASAYGESFDALIAIYPSENLMFGVSYDFTLTDIRNASSGSIEAAVQYCIGGKSEGDEYINPRFF